jgi:Ca-activated chloride channel family protein
MRWLIVSTCVAATVVAIRAQQVTFRGGVDVVSVDVSVEGARAPETGLTAGDFQLNDNGVPQDVELLGGDTIGIDLTLVLDVSGSVDGPAIDRLVRAAGEGASVLRPIDRLRLIATSSRSTEVLPWQSGGALPSLYSLTVGDGTAIYDGLADVLVRPNDPGRRQLVLALTDGDDNLSFLGFDGLQEIARRSDAVLHIIRPVTSASSSSPSALARSRLQQLAEDTGGQVFAVDAKDSAAPAFQHAIGAFSVSYILRYKPVNVARTGWHDIVVRVTKPGVYKVRARRGYSAG